MGTEAHWTPPSPWCPHPEYWHADQADADPAELEVTDGVGALIRLLQPEIVVETGTAEGATAYMIGSALQRNRHGHLYTVEIDPAAAGRARERVERLPVTVVCADSMTWEPPDRIDFAWIDSGTAEVRTGEIRQWSRKFSPGAIIGVHDTAPNMGREKLRDLACNLFAELEWPFVSLRTPRGVILAQVWLSRGPEPA